MVLFSSTITDITFIKQPDSIVRGIESNVETYTFASGDVKILNKYKSADRLTLNYTLTSEAFAAVNYLNDIMDGQVNVSVTGLNDTNLNTSYLISSVNANQKEAYDDMYELEITLERKYDRLI